VFWAPLAYRLSCRSLQVAEIEALKSQLDSLVSEKEALRLENEQLRVRQESAEAQEALVAALARHEAVASAANGAATPGRVPSIPVESRVQNSADDSDGQNAAEGPALVPGEQKAANGGREGEVATKSGRPSLAAESPGARAIGTRTSSSEDLQRLSEDNRALRAKLDELRSKSGALLRSPGTPGAFSREGGWPPSPATPGPHQSEIVVNSSIGGAAPESSPGAESAGDLIEDARLRRGVRTSSGSPFPVRLNGDDAGNIAVLSW
jgi:hypothetical protein